jgi:hypothetical protein
VERGWKFVSANRLLIVQMTTGATQCRQKFAEKVFAENLGMRKVSAEMVPHILFDDQKQR